VEVLPLMGAEETWPAQVEAACRDGWERAPDEEYGKPPHTNVVPGGRYVLLRWLGGRGRG
jgi:hypothetical protein